MADRTDIDVDAAITEAQQIQQASTQWNSTLAGIRGSLDPGAIAAALGHDEMGNQIAAQYQPAADSAMTAATQVGDGWATLADGAMAGAVAVQDQDAANARDMQG